MSYLLINKIKTKPGKRDEVVELLIKAGKVFDGNDACELYLVSLDKEKENVIWVQDVWKDSESHKRAMSDATMKRYVEKAIPLLEAMPQQFEIEAVGGKHPFKI